MKNFLKKSMALVMCLVMIMSLAACSQGEDDIMYEETKGETLKLIDDAWAAEYEKSDKSSYSSDLENLQNVTEQVQDISMELFRAGMSQGKNGMISPVSILMAMAMVENGAEGNSLAQMEEAFGCDAESLSSWLRAWSGSLRTSDDTRVNIANSFWFRDSEALSVKEEYLKKIAGNFNAQAYKAPFNQTTVDDMNAWVNENTYGMIKKLTDRIDPQNMTVILNATAFESAWEKTYETYQIREGEVFYCEDGTEETSAMMYSGERIFLENELMTGFKKPYKDGYSFVALLPREGRTVAECVASLDGETFRSLMAGARSEKVNAVIPEFTSGYTMDNLVETFADMGMTDIFSPAKADLSGMAQVSGENLYVTGILHKTFIEVNRTGTRAAAVTEIKVGATADMPVKIYDVRLDRPFIYAIVDDYTNTPMFMGTTMSVAAETE